MPVMNASGGRLIGVKFRMREQAVCGRLKNSLDTVFTAVPLLNVHPPSASDMPCGLEWAALLG
ncbi:hypothetical protein PSPTOT1_3682 [Pseudomonas syringae pv. tomato T1]|nr:hypothetical protein PSPTOT1_3682 [Pseudomonas syringae pv. tomato T1]